MGITDYQDLMDELAWIEKAKINSGYKMTLNLWIIVEASKRDGLTYEQIKQKAIAEVLP